MTDLNKFEAGDRVKITGPLDRHDSTVLREEFKGIEVTVLEDYGWEVHLRLDDGSFLKTARSSLTKIAEIFN